ncbi:MAG: hypothetical protein JWQ09_4776 [Segetibacter sp.]|nr:hypothetical protein [Segetibacter sp.]
MRSDDFYLSYNARHLEPQEVAKTFIMSESFEKLIQTNHSVILGARGCGKTTLMKMLTLPALHAWTDNRASNIRDNISFYSIYISTDIYWDVKNQTYSSQLKPFPKFAELISIFAVNSNVFTSLCDTFLSIVDFELQEKDPQKEIELCSELAAAWKFESVIPRLKFIKEAISKRVDQVNQLIQNVIFNYSNENDIPKFDFFNLSFESSLEHIIPVFERVYNITEKKKWALCFDELEFAPSWLQQKLYQSLRSRPQFLLYKLSASPILPSELQKYFKGEYTPTSGNDVQIIKMWTSKDNERFSRKLIDSLLYNRFGTNDSVNFFGTNDIYNKGQDSYEKGSSFYKEIKSLIAKDESFKSYMEGKIPDLNNPLPINSSQKDTLFRKIKPTVYFRNYFIEKNHIKGKNSFDITYRSRKTIDLFAGLEVLIKVCDGNPRWLIGIVSSILSKANEKGADRKLQYDELNGASKRFKNVIANIPIGNDSTVTLIDVIDKIGAFFYNEILGPKYHLDPRGTFKVDENNIDVSDSIVNLIEKGVSQGAIILLDCDDDSFDFEVRNHRFKISYLFFVLYKLPLRNYPSVKLSECLKNIQNHPVRQTTLF